MFRIISFFLTIILLLSLNLKSQNLQINEVVSKNYNGLESFEAKTEDWIEIFNNSNDTIQLQDYFLSDNESNLQLWQFPNKEIFPDSFLMVFASAENLFSPELHTNFKLSSKGEKLFLSKTNIIDSITIPVLNADFSYGRKNEQSNDWSVLDIPSPNKSNTLSNHLSFSHKSGFYAELFFLEINKLKPTHKIFYTFDGSEPNIYSQEFTNELLIENRSYLANNISEIRTGPELEIYHHNWQAPNNSIFKINSLKFRSFNGNEPSSNVYTKNYIIEREKSGLKTICVTVEPKKLFDFNDGIYVPGLFYNQDYPNFSGNYFSNKKVKAHFSLFDDNQKNIYNQNTELRIKGKTTRASAQKSMKFFAKKEYGNKLFETEIISKDFESYNSFVLRNTQGAKLKNLISDDLANLLIQDLDIDYTKTEFCQVFLNGSYWGIQSLRNELNEDFLKDKYNLKNTKINIIDINYETIQGDNSSFLALISFIENNDLSSFENFKIVAKQLDIDSYIDYQIAEMFLNNFDWPGNNSQLWKTDSPNSKWRFLFYDLDGSFIDENKNMFTYCTAEGSDDWRNADKYTFLLRNLLKNESFKTLFINRYLELLQNQFSKENTLQKLRLVIEKINPNIDENIERWHFPDSRTKWLDEIENMLVQFLNSRPCIVEFQLNKFFNFNSELQSCNTKIDKTTLNFILFPNPCKNSFSITTNSEHILGSVIISIYDINGKLILRKKVLLDKNNSFKLKNITIDKGIYYVKLESNDTHYGFQKLIISN